MMFFVGQKNSNFSEEKWDFGFLIVTLGSGCKIDLVAVLRGRMWFPVLKISSGYVLCWKMTGKKWVNLKSAQFQSIPVYFKDL